MNSFNRELGFAMVGEDVAALHQTLKALNFAIPDDETNKHYFGAGTQEAVKQFQSQHQLAATGVVDKQMAELLATGSSASDAHPRQVSGAVLTEDNQPTAQARVQVFHADENGLNLLNEGTTDHTGSYNLNYVAPSAKSVTNLQVSIVDSNGQHVVTSPIKPTISPQETIDLKVPGNVQLPTITLPQVPGLPTTPLPTTPTVPTIPLPLPTNPLPTIPLPLPTTPLPLPTVPLPTIPAPPTLPNPVDSNKVEGNLYFDYGLPASELKVRLYNRDFGTTGTLVKEVVSDSNGYFNIGYGIQSGVANIEIRVVSADGKEVSLSDPKYNASTHEVLNLIAPASVKDQGAEFDRLSAALSAHVKDGQLGTAKQNANQQDITLLHQATQWDGRLIAMAATAENLASTFNLPKNVVYGLLRGGLPSDPQQLANIGEKTFETVLNKAASSGIVNLDANDIAEVKKVYVANARRLRLQAPLPGSATTVSRLMDSTGLSGDDRSKFEQAFLTHQEAGTNLWDEAANANLDNKQISQLQLHGKLAYLTLNNPAVIPSLKGVIGDSNELSTLAVKGFYDSNIWTGHLKSLVNGEQKLETLIPAAYDGGTVDDRLLAYADDLAKKVRLAYPNHVLMARIDANEFHLGNQHDAVKGGVTTFIKNADKHDFVLGKTLIDPFVQQYSGDLFTGIDASQQQSVVDSVKMLQRVHQITPSDDAMQALLASGLTSAYNVTAYNFEDFMMYFGGKFSSSEEASLVYRKSKQVTTVTYTIYGLAKGADSAPPLYALSGTQEQHQAAKEHLHDQLKNYPTMTALFGSIDFCNCEQCRSVLSPAAYLTNLFQFIDPSDDVWTNFKKQWKKNHNGIDYPYANPYMVLTARRADLPYLQLTCENTNTVMPYIDIVNEILEYYVVKGTLGADAVHDTPSTATTPELLAEPENILPDAYDKLKSAIYPMALPFDLWLETVRLFFDHFNTPLWQVMEIFRTSDALFNSNGTPYRADFLAEYLGLSPSEYGIFTSASWVTDWYKLYGYDTRADALVGLVNGKMLADRLEVSYIDLTLLMQTHFLNPNLEGLAILYKLGLEADSMLRYKGQAGFTPFTAEEKQAFEARLTATTTKYRDAGFADFDAKARLDDAWTKGDFNKLLVLSDVAAGCSFEDATLCYVDNSAVDSLLLLKFNLFVRLMRKLGWSIDEVDQALKVFLPASTQPLTANNIGNTFRTVLIYMARLKQLDSQLQIGKNSRLALVTLWGNLPTQGAKSLYTQLFLKHSIRKNDNAFDDPLGQYLTKNNVFIRDHLPTLQAALNVSEDEIEQICRDVQLDIATAPLTLVTVSLLYRYTMLSKALRLKIEMFISLKALAHIDPFATMKADLLSDINDDYPYSQTLAFMEIVGKVSASSFKIEDLSYLLRHEFDPVGKYRFDEAGLVELFRTLANGIHQIQVDQALPIIPGTLSYDVLLQKMALALPPNVVEIFSALWQGSEIYAGDPKALIESYFVDFLIPSDIASLFAPLPTNSANAQQDALTRRRATLEGAFLPHLQAQLIRQLVHQTLTADLSAAAPMMEMLLTNSALLSDPTIPQTTPLLDAFSASGQAGVTVAYYITDDETGTPINAPALTTELSSAGQPSANSVHFDGYLEVPSTGTYQFFILLDKQNANAVLRFSDMPNALISSTANADNITLSGSIDLSAGVPYRFTLDGHHLGGGKIMLQVLGQSLPQGSLSRLILHPGALVDRVRSCYTRLSKALQVITGLNLSVREVQYLLTHGDDFDHVSLNELPTAATTGEAPSATQTRFAHFLRLIDYAALKSKLAANSDDLIDIFERGRIFPTPANDAGTTQALSDLYTLLANVTRRNRMLIEAVAKQFGFSATPSPVGSPTPISFANEKGIARLWEAVQTLYKLGISSGPYLTPSTVIAWTTIRMADKDTAYNIARNLRAVVKAQYEADDWQLVAQPIFDHLRQRQRDMLVTYIMNTNPDQFDSVDRLYEYFLIDPAMEPVVQTSRLRLAIASVQLFIQRCLLNLEVNVNPAAIIDADHWPWMKHYRVWEAGRKIFLFPENWLEPEFREDKTDLFKELEGTLMQSDISAELVEDACYKYLQKLEQLARLDIISTYTEEKTADPASNVLHVIGRTFSLPHKYFYRRYAHEMWTPWEALDLDIEGDHVVAVWWRDRLNLFWVNFLDKGPNVSAPGESTDKTKLTDMTVGQLNTMTGAVVKSKQVDVQLNWSQYYQGSWSTREASGFDAAQFTATILGSFESNAVSIHTSVEAGEDGAVLIHLVGGGFNVAFKVVSKHAPPENGTTIALPTPIYSASETVAGRYRGSGELTVNYVERIESVDGGQAKITNNPTAHIFQKGDGSFLLTIGNSPSYAPDDIAPIVTPFFFSDRQNTFYVEPSLDEVTTDEWTPWHVPSSGSTQVFIPDPNFWEHINLIPAFPIKLPIPSGPDPIDPYAHFTFQRQTDWVTDPMTLVQYDQGFIGERGGLDVTTVMVGTPQIGPFNTNVRVSAGSSLALGTTLVVNRNALDVSRNGILTTSKMVSVVGKDGLNPALLGSVQYSKDTDFNVGVNGGTFGVNL